MGEEQNRAAVEKMIGRSLEGDLDGLAIHYHDDIVVEWPQSGERITGKENALEVLRNYPGGMPTPTLRNIRAAGDVVIAEQTAKYPDGSEWYWTNIFQFRDGKVVQETDYFSQAFEPPEWRAQWVTKR